MITAWRCPNCLLPQPLNHFAVTACGQSVHPDYAAAVLADDRHSAKRRGRVGVSDGFGCPRRKLIADTEDIAVNPVAFNAMLTGTAWHDKMEATSEDPGACEVEVEGDIAGIHLVGHIDRVRSLDSALCIDDWKHTNAWSFKYLLDGYTNVPAKTPKAEHVVSVSVYAELYAQKFGVRPDYGTLWYHTTAGQPERGGGFLPLKIQFLPVEACLAFHPFNGEFALMDLWLQVQGGIEGSWRNLPLAGETQAFGKKKTACDYCAVKDICYKDALF